MHLFEFFDCACYVLLPPHKRTKLELCSQLCCFLGYGVEQKDYRCYNPITKHLWISHHVEFLKHKSFTSLLHFPHTYSNYSPIFIDLSIALFLESFDTVAENSSSSIDPSMATSSILDGSDGHHVASHNPESSQVSDLHHSSRVRDFLLLIFFMNLTLFMR